MTLQDWADHLVTNLGKGSVMDWGKVRMRTSHALVIVVSAAMLVASMMPVAVAHHEQVHCSGCVDKPDISKDAVGSWELLDGSIQKPDISKDAVGGWEVLNGSIGQADLGSNSVGGQEIKNGGVFAKDLSPWAKPQMWAQRQTSSSNTFPATSSNVEVNSLDIVAPTPGLLVISGTAYVNNNSGSAGEFLLQPKVDGAFVNPTAWHVQTRLDPDGASGDDTTLSYTEVVAVSGGAHTVSQEIEPGTSNWFYNGAYLTVTFYPNSMGELETFDPTSSSTGSSSVSADPEADGAS